MSEKDHAKARLSPAGDSAVLARFSDRIEARASAGVLALDDALRWDPFEGFVEATPSFAALLVRFDPLATGYEEAAAAIAELLQAGPAFDAASPRARRLWRLPTVYGEEYGPDLPELAAHAGVTPQAAARRHASAEHVVHMLGFLPGAPYLGGLPAEFDLPRLAEPRLKVPGGSVAIAGGLTVIYPVASPGGWRILGRTPAPLFDAERDPPALLAPGDAVRFEPVSAEEVSRLAERAAAGEWRPDFETAEAG